MKTLLSQIAVVLSAIVMQNSYSQSILPPYKDTALPIEVRVQDLLSHMTSDEKVGQLLCPLGWEMYEIAGDSVRPSGKFFEMMSKKHFGMLWGTFRADPWTKKTLDNGLNPYLAAMASNALQKYAVEQTRLGIPLFLAEEAPHGHMAIGTTVFPTGLGLAATWSPSLMRQAGEIIGKEIRSQGGHISYGPVLDLARDPRWSRVEETFGEDPYLSGTMGAAMVEGLGGGQLENPHSTIATLKHFIAYGASEAGQNGNPAFVGQRDIADQFLPPFRQALEAGALSVMTAYNSIDGIPCTSNKQLLTEKLRHDWRFRGIVVSDLYSIEGMSGTHRTASNVQEAARLALEAGVDIDLGGDAFAQLPERLLAQQPWRTALDTAVARVLRLKFEMGLFENPYVDAKLTKINVRNERHIHLARKIAQASVTLLKNSSSILPLSKSIRIAVVGPNADNTYNQLGDYTAPQEAGNVKTVLDGILAKLPASHVVYAKGCAVRDTLQTDIETAVAAAQNADVVVAVVGGSSARDFKTDYNDTGAANTDRTVLSDMDCGEGFDRATLHLLGKQEQLLQSLKATGKPLVVVYIEGRPMDKQWAATHADALLTAYYPGQEGGNAIADVLFGDANPAGRLPMTVPAHVGQIPIYYNRKNPFGHNYTDYSAQPLYPFGYGLSYTSFSYANLQIEKKTNFQFEITFDITNTGNFDGEEVPQLYIRDDFASTVQPIKQLRGFTRLFLKKGETKQVRFLIEEKDLSLTDTAMRHTVEPGSFSLYIGASSDDIRLTGSIEVK